MVGWNSSVSPENGVSTAPDTGRTYTGALTSSYCGMDDVRVQEGQVVSAGEALGVCADSIPAESALGTHVHVQVTQNDAPIDVLTLLDEDEPE